MQHPSDLITAWLAALPGAPMIAPDTALIEQGILDSIELLNLVAFLEERFGIALPAEAFVPEHFETPNAIIALVTALRAAEAA